MGQRRSWTLRRCGSWSDPLRRYEGPPLELPIERTESHWLVERTLEFIDAPRERPLLAICSFYDGQAVLREESLKDLPIHVHIVDDENTRGFEADGVDVNFFDFQRFSRFPGYRST